MKKLLLVLAVSGCACLAQADTMSFITVLSSPVGSFNKLETADPSLPAYGKAVNFCTQVGNGGVVELKGTQAAVLGRTDVAGGGVYLSSGTTLGKTDHGKYSLSRIDLKSGGNVKGGRLFGNTVTVGNAASGRAEALYGNTLTIAGAKTKTLDVNSGASKITAQHDGADMAWSNEYQKDDACKEGISYDKCKQQYLLKSASKTCSNTPSILTELRDCPSGTGTQTRTWNATSCSWGEWIGLCTTSYTCITHYQWRTVASSSSEDSGSCSGVYRWALAPYWSTMVCGDETSHMSGTKTFDDLKDCTPGQYYLYYKTYTCSGTSEGCRSPSGGYYCLRCGTVSSESECLAESSIPYMGGEPCSKNGGSGGLQDIIPDR